MYKFIYEKFPSKILGKKDQKLLFHEGPSSAPKANETAPNLEEYNNLKKVVDSIKANPATHNTNTHNKIVGIIQKIRKQYNVHEKTTPKLHKQLNDIKKNSSYAVNITVKNRTDERRKDAYFRQLYRATDQLKATLKATPVPTKKPDTTLNSPNKAFRRPDTAKKSPAERNERKFEAQKTQSQLQKLAHSVEVKIKFRKLKKSEIKEYDETQYGPNSKVKTNQAENLRESDKLDKIIKKIPRGKELVLTGKKRILTNNGQKRVYFEAYDPKKPESKGYIRGMSINPLSDEKGDKSYTANNITKKQLTSKETSTSKTTEKPKTKPSSKPKQEDSILSRLGNKLPDIDMDDIKKAGKKGLEAIDKAQTKIEATSAYQQKSTKEIFESKMGELKSLERQNKTSKVGIDKQGLYDNPKELKKLIDQRQLSPEALQSYYKVTQEYGLTIESLSKLMDDEDLTVGELLQETLKNEPPNSYEKQQLTKNFQKSRDYKELASERDDAKKELAVIEKNLDPKAIKKYVKAERNKYVFHLTSLEDDIASRKKSLERIKKEKADEVAQKENEIVQKQQEYIQKNYEKGSFTKRKSLYENYLANTRKIAEKDPKEADRRFKKLKDLLEFKNNFLSTRINTPEKSSITVDSVTSVEEDKHYDKFKNTLYKAIDKYAKANKIDSSKLEEVKTIINDEPLQLLATLTYTEGSLQKLFQKGIIDISPTGSATTTEILMKSENVSKINISSLVKALQLQKEYGSFGDSSPDNLTEALNYLQNNQKVASKMQQIAYEANLPEAVKGKKDHAIIDTHLAKIFDTNNTGRYSITETWFNTEYTTVTGADTAGKKGFKSLATKNGLQEFSSELSLYNVFRNEILDYNKDGELVPSKEKYAAKTKELVMKGLQILPMYFALRSDLKPKDIAKKKASFEKAMKEFNSSDINKPLSTEIVELIRLGIEQENILAQGEEKFQAKADAKLAKLGVKPGELQAAYSAIGRSLMFLKKHEDSPIAKEEIGDSSVNVNNLGLAVGKQYKLGDGVTLGVSAGGSYSINHPALSTAISLNKSFESGWQLNSALGASASKSGIEVGLNAEVGYAGETFAGAVGIGVPLLLAGVPVYARFSGKWDRFSEDKNERFQQGLERVSAGKKITPELFKKINLLRENPKKITEKDYKEISTALDLEKGIQAQKNLNEAQKNELRKTMVETIIRRLENVSIQDADKWNFGYSVTAGVLLGSNIPFVIPALTIETPERTEVQTMITDSELTETQIKSALKEAKKTFGTNKEITISSQGKIITYDKKGREILLQNFEGLSEIQSQSSNQEQLNKLREKTGLTFKSTIPGSYEVSIDKIAGLDKEVQDSERYEIYLDADVQKIFSISKSDQKGKFNLSSYKDKLPSNLVILKETITDPHMSSGANTITRISFTTKENYLTGRDVENMNSGGKKIAFNPDGTTVLHNDPISGKRERAVTNIGTGGSLELANLGENREGLKYTKTFNQEELNKLSSLSKVGIERFSRKLDTTSYKPSESIKKALDKLSKKPVILKQIAELTTIRIAANKQPNFQEAFKLINKETGEKVTKKEDIIFILGNLQPYSYRSINQIDKKKRVDKIKENAEKYTKEHITELCKHCKKTNGENFSSQEQAIIIEELTKLNKPTPAMIKALQGEQVKTQKTPKELLGYSILTTAHRGNLKGLRKTIVTREYKPEIIQNSIQDIDKKIKDPKRRELVKEFLQNINYPVQTINNLDSVTKLEQLDASQKEILKQNLNSRTAKTLLSLALAKNNKEYISLTSLIFGEDTKALNEIFEKGEIEDFNNPAFKDPAKLKTILKFAKLVQDIHTKQKVELQDIKGNPININLKAKAGVVHLGKCANPSYIFNQELSVDSAFQRYQINAASASGQNRYSQGKAKRQFDDVTIGLSLAGQAKTEPTTSKEDPPGDNPPGDGGGPSKTDTPRFETPENPTDTPTERSNAQIDSPF